MSSQRTFSEMLRGELDVPPEFDFGGMIEDLPPARPSTIDRKPDIPSLGDLKRLPTELLLNTIRVLDFQSLSRLSRTSLVLKATVEALPAYKEMMQYAPQVLTALGWTRLIRYHSAPLLCQTLREDKCVSCFDFGAYLFLPTCERACYECLYRNQWLWVTTEHMAKSFFCLTNAQLEKIPVMYSIPGVYRIADHIHRARVGRFFSVKQVKQLAIDVHGSMDIMERRLPSRLLENYTLEGMLMCKTLHLTPMQPPGCDMSRLPDWPSLVVDGFAGMASIRIPLLTDAGQDAGRLCRGCKVTQVLYSDNKLPGNVLQRLTTPVRDPFDDISEPLYEPLLPLLAGVSRLRSTAGLLEHMKQCYGMRHLFKEQEKAP